MRDSERHWFYGTRRASAYVTAERVQQEFWRYRSYETHVWCLQSEAPCLFRGYWKGHAFDLEFEPGKSLVYRADAELPWVIEILTRSLRRSPSFRYRDNEDRYVFEWWVEGGEARWQAMQGRPAFKELVRLDGKK